MASLRGAINGFCRQCIYDPVGGTGAWREQVADCTSYRCPLWPVRPVTKARRSAELVDFPAAAARSAPDPYDGPPEPPAAA